MQCSEVRELLSPFHDGELPDHLRLVVEAHLVICSECRAELEGFQKLSEMASALPDPAVPPGVWFDLEAKVASTTPSVSPAGQKGPVTRRRWLTAAIVAATLLVGAGLWFRHGDHDHLAVDFDAYLKQFDNNVEAAQTVLLANYHGRPATLAEASQVLKYEPAVEKGMPEGYAFHVGYLFKMPCCECLEAVYSRPQGGYVAVFEHEKDQPVWFGHRPSIECQCGGKLTHLVQLDGTLAATCLMGTRFVTIIGPKSVEEVSAIVRQLVGTVAGRHS